MLRTQYWFHFLKAANDINAPASAQANKTFLPWETHLFTRLLKYGEDKYRVLGRLFLV